MPEFRDMTARDRRFVVPTWALSSTYDGARKQARFRIVDNVLDAGGAQVVVYGGANGAVHAWACGNAEILHYVYVAQPLRGEGLARRCIEELMGGYHDSIIVTHPWPIHRPRFVYEPRALTRKKAS